MSHKFRLVISCPDRPGIVSDVSGFVAGHGGNILEANQYHDPATGMFFMRYVIDTESLRMDAAGFREAFLPVAERYAMNWHLTDTAKPRKVLLMVSKLDHCLTDLLYRWKCGDLEFDIPCVISNHDDMRKYVEWHGITYYHVPVPKEADGKEEAFRATADIIDKHKPDTVVLARYMQILPPWMCEKYPHQVINIHHSFLPSFMGAKPYHQAKERGVKLTGATCHYVTQDLDAGPIIEQDVARVSHYDSVEESVRLGKDVEKTVLARGLRYHLEDRVLVHNNKTIVFN
jgi:formyltetrahydrofolate deformylase